MSWELISQSHENSHESGFGLLCDKPEASVGFFQMDTAGGAIKQDHHTESQWVTDLLKMMVEDLTCHR